MGALASFDLALDVSAVFLALTLASRRLLEPEAPARSLAWLCVAVAALSATDAWVRAAESAGMATLVPSALFVASGLAFIGAYAVYSWRGYALFGISPVLVALPLAALLLQLLCPGVSVLGPVCAGGLLLVTSSVQLRRERLLLEREAELVEARTETALSQIQPHFMYNTLTAIRHLCRTDPPRARQTIEGFSLYLRGNMESLQARGPIAFEDEMRHTQKYLELEQLRLGERLRVRTSIQSADFAIPALTVQTLVENAVRHGISKRESGGDLVIETRSDSTCNYVRVVDNGVGFDPSSPPDDGRAHVGIANARLRLEHMCQGSLLVESEPGHGTRATVVLPRLDAARGGLWNTGRRSQW